MTERVRRGSKGLLRDINNSRVLSVIQSRGPISRAEIAKMTALQPPTVTHIVNGFIAAGLVHETEITQSSVGRPPIMLTLNPRGAFAVGAKLSRDRLTVAITDLTGALIDHRDRALDQLDPESVLEDLATDVSLVLNHPAIDGAPVLGVGIGMPGLIDYAAGICRYSTLLGWRDVDVRRSLQHTLDLPIYVDNDVNMLTAAEVAFGVGRDVNDFLTVTIGRGIGLGIVIRGEIYRGRFGGAGEFGHTKIDTGLLCECGAIGCLESAASEPAICARVTAALGTPSIDIGEAVRLARTRNAMVLEVFESAGRALGRSIGNLLNLFNPELVIVTGEGTRCGSWLFGPMQQAIHDTGFGLLRDDTEIRIQEWGDEKWAQGAASIVVHEILRPPIYESASAPPLGVMLDRGIRHRSRKR